MDTQPHKETKNTHAHTENMQKHTQHTPHKKMQPMGWHAVATRRRVPLKIMRLLCYRMNLCKRKARHFTRYKWMITLMFSPNSGLPGRYGRGSVILTFSHLLSASIFACSDAHLSTLSVRFV